MKWINDREMIIGGWVAPPATEQNGKNFLTDEVFRMVKESGVNVLYAIYDADLDKLRKMAKCAENAGVYLIVSADCIHKNQSDEGIAEFLQVCRDSKGIIGLNFFDEPGSNRFAWLREMKDKYAEGMGDLLFYVNMLPMYATPAQLAGGWWTPEKGSNKREYADFIEEYMAKVQPPVLSYDFYPFRHEKGGSDFDYFVNLSICSKAAKKYGVPLWNFTQVTSWARDVIRNTTYSEIQWLNATSLAYGVTGIQYFCYWSPFDANGESFLSAMIDKNGNPTRSYYFVKEANAHLRAVEKYILEAKHIGVISYGDTLAPVPHEDDLERFGNLNRVEGEGMLIGCFEYHGKNMYYVVNTSVFEHRVIELPFPDGLRLKKVKGTHEYEACGKVMETIAPGEGVLFVEA